LFNLQSAKIMLTKEGLCNCVGAKNSNQFNKLEIIDIDLVGIYAGGIIGTKYNRFGFRNNLGSPEPKLIRFREFI
jgi:hypothetical protein